MFSNLTDSISRSVITNIEGGLGSRLRYEYYKRKLKGCGGYFTTGAGFRMEGCEHISIGKQCSFNDGVWIDVSCELVIGDNVIVGPYSIIRDANHGYSVVDIPMRYQDKTMAPIAIGEDVWIGAMCVVLKGVAIGNGAVVAAHSLVNRDIPDFEVWGGVPVRKLRSRI